MAINVDVAFLLIFMMKKIVILVTIIILHEIQLNCFFSRSKKKLTFKKYKSELYKAVSSYDLNRLVKLSKSSAFDPNMEVDDPYHWHEARSDLLLCHLIITPRYKKFNPFIEKMIPLVQFLLNAGANIHKLRTVYQDPKRDELYKKIIKVYSPMEHAKQMLATSEYEEQKNCFRIILGLFKDSERYKNI